MPQASGTGTGILAPRDAVEVRRRVNSMRVELNAALLGKSDVIEHVLSCLLARGHLLLEDLPGLGKTTLAKALAHAVGGHFARVQCTPDLLPGDITGFSIFNAKTREFEFRPGPVFSEILLVDEINRATPRTQSALLEAMAETQVTVDNLRHTLAPTFFVIATQNPAEQFGTYPLPEAQLDRFAMKLSVGYPGRADELTMLSAAVGNLERPAASAQREGAMDVAFLAELQQMTACVSVAPALQEYLVNFAAASRSHEHIRMGLSPRGLLVWQRLAQARAFLEERDFVTPDDLQHVAEPVLSPRLAVGSSNAAQIIGELLASVPLPAYAQHA